MYLKSFLGFLQVHVDRGMNDSQKITFRGEGDQEVSIKGMMIAELMFTNQANLILLSSVFFLMYKGSRER